MKRKGKVRRLRWTAAVQAVPPNRAAPRCLCGKNTAATKAERATYAREGTAWGDGPVVLTERKVAATKAERREAAKAQVAGVGPRDKLKKGLMAKRHTQMVSCSG